MKIFKKQPVFKILYEENCNEFCFDEEEKREMKRLYKISFVICSALISILSGVISFLGRFYA